jgi:hypothetical protein
MTRFCIIRSGLPIAMLFHSLDWHDAIAQEMRQRQAVLLLPVRKVQEQS